MNIKITADSTCDLSPELVRDYGIEIIPLYVIEDTETYRDGVGFTPHDVFSYFDQTSKLCKTAAVNTADYVEVFSRLSAQYDAVIHLDISLDFSSCYQNATLAAQEFSNVYVVDSRSLSTGIGLLVLRAAELARTDMPPAEIAATLRQLTQNVEASFVIDTLTYLQKGGRCSSLAALGATLLHLKPCIEVRDGKMLVGKKFRGSLPKVISAYVRDRLNGRDDLDLSRIFITHTCDDPALIESVRKEILQYAPFAEILDTYAGCTVASHCGPGTLGILFLRKQ